MFIDYKDTMWSRIQVPDNELGEKMIKFIKDGNDIDDLYNNFIGEFTSEPLHETCSSLTVRENSDNATIEILDSSMDTVWDNTEIDQ